jgi:hypothetical protein
VREAPAKTQENEMLGKIGPRLAEQVKAVPQVAAVNRTATTAIKGTGVEVNGKPVTMLFGLGAMGASTTADFKVQESDTDVDGNYADITGAAAVQLVTADANKVGMVDVKTTKKYARVVHTPGGTVANGILGYASLLIYGHESLPVVNSPVAVIV